MPFEIIYLPEEGGVITNFWGTVKDDDLIKSGREKCSSLNKMESYRYALTDLSQVDDFQVTSVGIKANARISSEIFEVNDDVIVAFVFPTVLIYGMGRMWQGYADNTNKRSQIFDTRAEAEAWLKKFLVDLTDSSFGKSSNFSS